jgi:hypothetical protein
VAAVNHLEERNLGIAREVHILSAICNKLHQTTTRHLLYTPFTEINSGEWGKFGKKRKFSPPCRER